MPIQLHLYALADGLENSVPHSRAALGKLRPAATRAPEALENKGMAQLRKEPNLSTKALMEFYSPLDFFFPTSQINPEL